MNKIVLLKTTRLSKIRRKTVNSIAKVMVTSATLFLTLCVQSAELSYDNLQKQLDIMNNIMLSSAKVQQNSRQSLIRSIDSVYLHQQGALFTIKSAYGDSRGQQFFQMLKPMPTVAPMPPVAPIPPKEQLNIGRGADEEIETEQRVAQFERAFEEFEQQRQGFRELSSEQREVNYELRALTREVKDIQYQLKHAEKKTKEKLTNSLKDLEKKRVSLTKDQAKLAQKSAQLTQVISQQKLAQEKARKAHFSKLNNILVETLCLYGNGLKAIPTSEHVSLIIRGAGSEQGSNYRDEIYVFAIKDINSCANSKISTEQLLSKAKQYQF